MEDSQSLSSRSSAFFSDGPMMVVLSVFAFLVPFFFVPVAIFPFQFSKVMLALVAVVAILIAYAIRTIRSGAFSFSVSWLSLALVALPLTYLISAIFSSVPSLSFIGYQLDQDTFGFMALGGALAIATSVAATSENRIAKILFAIFVGSLVAIVFQLIQIFFGTPLNFGLFSSPIQNLLGKWNDLALFAGLIASLSLLALEAVTLSKAKKVVLSVTLFLCVTLMVFANMPLAWSMLGLVAFMALIFSFMRRHLGGGQSTVSLGTSGVAPGIVLAVVLFFFLFGSGVAGALQERFAISALEVSPSFQGTLGVIESVYAKSPFFGSGPNTFVGEWLVSRPAETLSTIFWNTQFNSGFAYIPTALATGGIVVGLGWLALIGLFLLLAGRALLTVSPTGERAYFLTVATALGSAFLLAVHLFYNPSQALTLLLFLFLGLFLASLQGTPLSRRVLISFSESPRLGFASVVGIAIAMVLSIVSVYAVGAVYASSVVAGQAVVRSNAGDLAGALSSAQRAALLSPQDRYFRTIAGLQLASLNQIVQSGKSDTETQTAFQNTLSQAVSSAATGTALDPLSYDNWMVRASVYEAVVPLNIQGATENAVAALETARTLNPNSPEVDYHEANLKAFAKDNEGARASATAAIAKKADYTPAILLLAQISLNEGNLNDAISSLKSAIVFTPNDSSLIYQLGLLELQAKRYQLAADAFTQALVITPDFANASFFLGQADVFLGKRDEALAIFQELQKENADNVTLKDVIAQLQKGQNPFTSGTALPPETSPKPAQ